MRRTLLGAIALMFIACGGDTQTPVSPTPPPSAAPAPAPSMTTIDGTITDTVTKAVVGRFTQMVSSLPARVTVSAPGYVTREAMVRAATATVDLFPEGGFDLAFYRQFVRNDFQRGADPLQVSWVLEQEPSFYLEVEGAKGVSAQVAQRLEQVARRTVPLMTGGRFQVNRWETGPTPRSPQNGWIVIERADLGSDVCGRALVGATAGQIWLHSDNVCNLEGVLAHEIGHALGFFHVNIPSAMMFPQARRSNISDAPIEQERVHATLAYSRPRGSRDIDIDPQSSQPARAAGVID